MEKSTFKLIFAILALALLFLPLITTFNEILTKVIMEIKIYRLIQEIIVPFETRWVTATLRLFGIEANPTLTSVNVGRYSIIGNNVTISWNCIGWQSFILLLITLATGLQGAYTAFSKAKTLILGVFGTFLLNIARMTIFVLLTYRVSPHLAIIFHDYFSTLLVVLWLFLFWWFSYNHVLESSSQYQQ